MKKKRMYLLIMIPVLTLYLASCGVMYFIARGTASDLFQSGVGYDRSVTSRYLESDLLASCTSPSAYIAYLSEMLNEEEYAFQYNLIDAEGNVAASGGSSIILTGTEEAFEEAGLDGLDLASRDEEEKELIIDLSDLLTEEMRSFLLNKANVKKYGIKDANFLDELTYYVKDNTIIPVSLTFTGLWYEGDSLSAGEAKQNSAAGQKDSAITVGEDGQITFCFSSHRADEVLSLTPLSTLGSNVHFDSLDCTCFGTEVSETAERIRKDFQEHLNNTEASLHYRFYAPENLTEIEEWSVFIEKETAYLVWNVSLNGIPYMLVLMIGENLNYEALHSSAFLEYVIGAGILFLILMMAALYAAGKMYDKNKQLNDARLAFTSAVAHEMKTPLAVIQSQCECIMEGVAPEKNEEYLSAIYEEARRMNRMVLSFLQYNRLSMTDKLELTRADISAIIREETEKYLPLLEDSDRKVQVEIEDHIYGMVHPDLFRLAVDNFLSNAARYTTPSQESPQGSISIRFDRQKKGFCFRIRNTCDSRQISAGNLWNVLSKGDSSRHRDQNATGMGLPIAAEILKLHNMDYTCEKKPGGIEFTFYGFTIL